MDEIPLPIIGVFQNQYECLSVCCIIREGSMQLLGRMTHRTIEWFMLLFLEASSL